MNSPDQITILTDRGPMGCLGYPVLVPGLAANRVDGTGRDWTLTHLGSGRHFGVSLPSLADVRGCVRVTGQHCNDLKIAPGWLFTRNGPLSHAVASDRSHRLWALQFQRHACMMGGRRIEGRRSSGTDQADRGSHPRAPG